MRLVLGGILPGRTMTRQHVKMAANGGLVLPAVLRTEIGLPDGGDFLARIENGVVILEPHKKVLERIRNLVRIHAPAPEGVSVVDELIAERHAVAAAMEFRRRGSPEAELAFDEECPKTTVED